MIDEKKMKCKKCGYEWVTRSQMVYVSCPSCKYPNKIVEREKARAVKQK